ncbi:MAG: DNA methyltransferase [Candidatus Muiribacteriota bacterium]
MKDYSQRKYLSSVEAASYLGVTVETLRTYVKNKKITNITSASGQKRYDLKNLNNFQKNKKLKTKKVSANIPKINIVERFNTVQKIFNSSATDMQELDDNSVHLMITSPPYFNAKMYARDYIPDNLGDIHDLDQWFEEINKVWAECFRVLAPGRKAFVNIMNLPVRTKKTYRTLNLVGRTIDEMEKQGFIFKRDIIWHKTNGVRAHFGTYPYPGGILLNNMHEFILEFEKKVTKTVKKYAHVTQEQRESSKLDKDFWLSIKNSDVWTMKPEKSGGGRKHVAPFPYELPRRIIKAYSYVGETVLDPFLGSGTTLAAGMDLGRDGAGYEVVDEISNKTVDYLKNREKKKLIYEK